MPLKTLFIQIANLKFSVLLLVADAFLLCAFHYFIPETSTLKR